MKILKYKAFFTVFIILSTICNAQRERIDSLKKVLPALKDSARIDCLNALSVAYANIQTDTAVIFAVQALEEAGRNGYTKGTANAYYSFGQIECAKGENFPEMEQHSKTAVALFEKIHDEKKYAKSVFLLGIAYWAQSKFSHAIVEFHKALQFYLKTGDVINIGIAYNYLSHVEEERGYYEKSLQYCLKGLEVQKKSNDLIGLTTLANLYRNIGDYETALDYYRQTEKYAKADNVNGLFYLYLMMGQNFYFLNHYDSALHYYQLLSEYIHPNLPHSPPGKYGFSGKLYSRLGEVYRALGEEEKGLVYLKDALAGFKKANDINQVMWVLLRLSRTYKETKYHKKSYSI